MDIYRKVSLMGKGLLISSLLVACAEKQAVPVEEMNVSWVTVHHAPLSIHMPASYQWSKGFTRQAVTGRLQSVDMWTLLKQAIEQEMQRKGYKQAVLAAQADLNISFAAALNSTLDDNQIQQKYGLVPGLMVNAADPERYEKGTLIFDVVNPKTHKLAWRTAGQALATLAELPLTERKARIAIFVKKLLAFLPEKE